LHAEEAKEKAMLESIGDGVIAIDENMKILFVNQSGEHMLGIKNEEVLGHSVFDVVRAEDEKGNLLSPDDRLLRRSLDAQETISRTNYYVRKDNSRFPAAVTVSPIVLRGMSTGVINTFRDITKELEVDRAKNEFVSLASHQLRTPPTGIKWFGGMLLEEEVGPINPNQRAYLEEIMYNNERMIEVVNAMLSVSRIEMGTFSIKPRPTDPSELVENLLVELSTQIREKRISILKNYSSPMQTVLFDPTLVTIIFQNLLNNAVKYTPKNGTISLSLSLVGPELLFSVADTGLGIPQSQQEKIFTKLFRADNARAADSSGSGLGLYIVKLVVNELGGHITFTSKEHEGTTFVVRVPISDALKPPRGGGAKGIVHEEKN
jgi:PAS domain S-box-containing protein